MCLATQGRLQGRVAKLLRARWKYRYSEHLGNLHSSKRPGGLVSCRQRRGGVVFA